ncbi:dihydrofolate reductase [Serendipita sp. 411]|nr:dihydrofolate reductase [Serendipita sp. 397]KAG8837219.1 dihydrofolate reductase [Serendipita sp. 411]
MQSLPPSVTLIVAATLNNGIGVGGRLPWRLSKEMAYFANITSFVPPSSSSSEEVENVNLRNMVIMGRKTWDGIPLKFRPLKNRINVVVSRGYPPLFQEESEPLVVKTNDVDEACAFQNGETGSTVVYRRFLIGGAQLYQHALARPISTRYHLDRILLTRIVEPAFDACDVFLPEFRSSSQIAIEIINPEGVSNEAEGQRQINEDEEREEKWRRASHQELSDWAGFQVPEGVQEEKGVKYVFQMWVRRKIRADIDSTQNEKPDFV